MASNVEGTHAGRQFGSFKIIKRLGRGGMGEVYLAHDETLDRYVALKTLLHRYAQDNALKQRFQREARAAAKLNHPNIVQVHLVDADADPPYLVMEYVDGTSLDSFITPEKRLSWKQCLGIAGQVAAALECAHAAGVIHRDIKPQNILIDSKERVRVTDFGIAKMLGSNTSLTGDNATMGSPCYMSPEQCGVGDIVPASDLFSLGITLFEMIAGRLPFIAETPLGVVRMIASEPLPSLRELAPDTPLVVQAFVEKLAARDPAQRYVCATEVLDDLKVLRAGQVPERLKAFMAGVELGTAGTAPPSAAASSGVDSAEGLFSSTSLVDELMEGTGGAFTKPLPKPGFSVPWVPLAIAAGAVLLGLLLYPLVTGQWRSNPAEAPTAPPPRDGNKPAERPDAPYPYPHPSLGEPKAGPPPGGQGWRPPPPGFPPPNGGQRPNGDRQAGPPPGFPPPPQRGAS